MKTITNEGASLSLSMGNAEAVDPSAGTGLPLWKVTAIGVGSAIVSSTASGLIVHHVTKKSTTKSVADNAMNAEELRAARDLAEEIANLWKKVEKAEEKAAEKAEKAA